MARTVWAFEPIDELAGELGYVLVDDDKLAARLIKSGAVQDPYDPAVGPLELKALTSEPAKGGYKHRQMKAADDAPDQADPPDGGSKRGRPPKGR